MIEGGDVLDLETTDWNGDPVLFTARVLFWWEVQGARYESVVKDPMSGRNYLDMAILQKKMVDLCLRSITSDGKTIEKADLDGVSWRSRLHPRAVPLIYDEYVNRCHSTREEMMQFADDVQAYFHPDMRDGQGIYVAPPEIFEAIMLQKMGGITATELKMLSYDKLQKFKAVMDQIPSSFNSMQSQARDMHSGDSGRFEGMIPTNVLSNSNLTSVEASMASSQIADQDLSGLNDGVKGPMSPST